MGHRTPQAPSPVDAKGKAATTGKGKAAGATPATAGKEKKEEKVDEFIKPEEVRGSFERGGEGARKSAGGGVEGSLFVCIALNTGSAMLCLWG